jgi:hypothetical protein
MAVNYLSGLTAYRTLKDPALAKRVEMLCKTNQTPGGSERLSLSMEACVKPF